MKIPTSCEVGQALERAVRQFATVCVAVYVAGYTLGAWIHRTNDQLARFYVTFLGLAPNAPAPAAASVVAPEPPEPPALPAVVVHVERPLTADQLLQKTNAELRELAGTKSRKSKAHLIELILNKN